VKIKDDVDLFLNGLFEFRSAREQLRGWESATYIIKHEATSTDIGSDDDSNEDDANKWTPTKIDLFKDFEHIHLDEMKQWAQVICDSDDVTLAAKDGQSQEYARKVFSEFIFGLMEVNLQKAIQNAISPSRLWNDRPCIWAMLVHHFFPSPVALKTTLLHKMKTATLSGHDNDLKAYCATLLDMTAVINTLMHNEEPITAFLTQTNIHLSNIVHAHFNHIGLQYYMKHDTKKFSFTSMLGDANHIHTITTSPALPFAASAASSSKSQEHIAALTGMLQKQNGHMHKIIAAVSQIDNRVKQSLVSCTKANKKGNDCESNGHHEELPFMKEAPTDPTEVKKWNNKPWYYCKTCGRWSTTHSTNGFKHNGKEIAKHDGSSPCKRRNNQSSSPQSNTTNKKTKTSQEPITGLQSLQAELKSENSSTLFELIQNAAAGAQ
jgi:hypothetical protein